MYQFHEFKPHNTTMEHKKSRLQYNFLSQIWSGIGTK